MKRQKDLRVAKNPKTKNEEKSRHTHTRDVEVQKLKATVTAQKKLLEIKASKNIVDTICIFDVAAQVVPRLQHRKYYSMTTKI